MHDQTNFKRLSSFVTEGHSQQELGVYLKQCFSRGTLKPLFLFKKKTRWLLESTCRERNNLLNLLQVLTAKTFSVKMSKVVPFELHRVTVEHGSVAKQ